MLAHNNPYSSDINFEFKTTNMFISDGSKF